MGCPEHGILGIVTELGVPGIVMSSPELGVPVVVTKYSGLGVPGVVRESPELGVPEVIVVCPKHFPLAMSMFRSRVAPAGVFSVPVTSLMR